MRPQGDGPRRLGKNEANAVQAFGADGERAFARTAPWEPIPTQAPGGIETEREPATSARTKNRILAENDGK